MGVLQAECYLATTPRGTERTKLRARAERIGNYLATRGTALWTGIRLPNQPKQIESTSFCLCIVCIFLPHFAGGRGKHVGRPDAAPHAGARPGGQTRGDALPVGIAPV